MSQQNGHYPFGRTYQEKVVALLIKDRTFLPSHRDVIRPYYFEEQPLVDLARLAVSYFDKYRQPPTAEAMEQAVRETAEAREEAKRIPLEAAWKRILETPVEEAPELRDRVVRFAVNQELLAALTESIGDLEAGEHERIRRRIDKALAVGRDGGSLGVRYLNDFDRLYWEREEHVLSTGYPRIDGWLSGGLAPGELMVVCAATGRGKTWYMLNAAARAFEQGWSVVHYSLEMAERQVCGRLDQITFSKDRAWRRDNPREIEAGLRRLAEHRRNNIVVKQLLGRTATLDTIETHLFQLEAEGLIKRGKVLINVDYARLLRPRQRIEGARHQEIVENYVGCRELAKEWEGVCITGIQGNRDAYSKARVGPQDFAGAFDVSGDADVIAALCQTEDEAEEQVLRVYLPKVRDGITGGTSVLRYEEEIRRFEEADDELQKRWAGEAAAVPSRVRKVVRRRARS